VAVANVVAKFEADISDVQAKMATLRSSFAQAGDSTEALSQRMVMLGNTVSNVGKQMTLGITAPLAALGVIAIQTQKDFEVSMNTLGVVSGAAAAEVQALSDYAMKMGADTVYSAGEAANAMVDLAKSGFTPAQISGGGLAATMALAATEGMALTDAAVTVANAMATFGLEANQASSIADALAGGANASTASVESLTSALRQVGPGAVNAGMSLQETVATLAAFDAAGIKGSDAGTSLKTMLMRLVPTSQEAADSMRQLGIDFTNADGSFKSITEIAQILQNRLGGLSEAQRVQALTTIFGADATRAATVLMTEGASGLQTYIDGTNQLGAAQELANARMKGTAGTLEQLKGSLETAALVIGENLAPTFQVLANLVKSVTDAFLTLPKPLQQITVAAGAVAAAMGPILWVGGKIIVLMASMSKAFVAARVSITLAFRQIAAGAKATQIQIQTSMIAARTSMGALVAGARAAGAGFVATFRTMTGAIRGFMAALGPVGLAIIGASVAYEVFVGAQQEAEDKVNSLTDAMKEQNAVMGEAVALQLAQDLQELAYGFAENTKFVDDLAALGLTLDEVIMALMQGGDAMQQLTTRVNEAAAGNDKLRMAAGNVIGTLAMENESVNQARAQYESYNTAKALAAQVTGQVADATTGLTSATVSAAIAAGEAIAPTQGLTSSMTDLGTAAGETATEIDIMRQEYNEWISVTGQIAAVDTAAASIDNLGAASVEFGTNLMGQTPKARDFRGEVVKAFEDSAAAAASLSDDIPTQRAIFTGELIKIVNALKASGVKPADIEAFLGAMDGLPASVSDIMRSAAKAVGDTDFKTQVEKAFDKSVKAGAPMTADAMARLAEGASTAAKDQLGLTLEPELASIIKSGTTALRPTAFNNGELTGRSIGSGAAYGINQSSPVVIAAVDRVMAQAKAAADAAVDARSPSRVFMGLGKDIVQGLANGITYNIPRATGAASKLANSLAQAFSQALAANSGSVASAISQVFGNIPTKSPLEELLGVKGAEKFIKNNKKALAELLKLGEAIDAINEKVRFAGEGFASLGDLVARPFGRESQITEMFGSEADIDSVIDGFLSIRDQVRQAYSVLTDASIVGEKAAARNRKEMQKTIGELRKLSAQAVELRRQYDTVMQELETLEQDYQKSIAETNAFYDVAEKKAEENIKAIEDRWAAAIPGLEAALKGANEAFDKENAVLQRLIQERDQFVGQIKSGFRSFVNSLSFESSKASKQIVKETKRLANGITVTLERELEVGGGPAAIRQTLEERLAAVRDFSRNIRTLMQRGLDPSLVQDFVSAGVSGAGDAAAALAAGSQEDIAAINSVQAQLLAEADDFGAYASAQWHDIGVAQQQAIVRPLEVARDAAQKALDDANDLRDEELKTARDHLETLKDQRRDALLEIEGNYLAEKARLDGEATKLQTQMDEVAAKIEAKILAMLNTTAVKSAEAGMKAGAELLAGFQNKYPEVYDKLNRLMDQLARSLTRTATVTVKTVYDATVPVQTAGRGAGRARAAFTPDPTGVNVGTVSVPYASSAAPVSTNNLYQITVNAGVGDPREIGRVTVEAIKAYERSNGRVFASA
jgi:TP901 family phage tail tape measure protein